MRVKLLKLDTPISGSGRTYPTEVVQHAIDILVEKNPSYMLGVTEDINVAPTLSNSVGVLQDLKIENSILSGELVSIENMLSKFDGKKVIIKPIAIGECDANGIIQEGYILFGGTIEEVSN